MSAARAVPAGLLQRYAAWSLDMALLGTVALAVCAPRLHAALPRVTASFDALARSMAASMLDMLVQGGTPLALSRQWLSDPQQRALAGGLSQALADVVVPPLLLACALALAWFTFWESSSRQATPGKRAIGLRVCTAAGGRPGAVRAAARQLAGTLSWLSLNIGHLLALTPPGHQALHDRMAGMRVVSDRGEPAVPRWAWAWLALQAAAALAASAALFLATQAAMQRALDSLLA